MTPACSSERFLRLAEVRGITGISIVVVYANQADIESLRKICLGYSAQVCMYSYV